MGVEFDDLLLVLDGIGGEQFACEKENSRSAGFAKVWYDAECNARFST